MLTDSNYVPEKIRAVIRTNGGGRYNHSLFWQIMKKNGGGEPAGELAAAIKKAFGSFANFKKQFTEAAMSQPGDGWAWLTLDAGKLKVEALPNEETPLSQGRPVLLGIDLWDHAYQLQYGKNRAEHVAAWFNVINWDFVAERYSRLKLKH
jgi:Fe-Mn family superoxide dismutase